MPDVQPNRKVTESLGLGLPRGPTEAGKVKGSEQHLKVPEGEQAGVHLHLQNGNQGQNSITARTAKKEEIHTSEQKPRR